MSQRDELYLADILEACHKIVKRVQNISRSEWESDDVLFDATLRQLTIIGEAMSQISTDLQNQYKNVEWRDIRVFRNIIVHRYFRVDAEIIWNVMTRDVPVLLTQIEKILSDIDTSPSSNE